MWRGIYCGLAYTNGLGNLMVGLGEVHSMQDIFIESKKETNRDFYLFVKRMVFFLV